MAGKNSKSGRSSGGASGGSTVAARPDWREDLRRVTTTRHEDIKASDLRGIQTSIRHTQQKIFAVQNQLNNPKFKNTRSLIRQLDKHGNVSTMEDRLSSLRAKEGYALKLNGAANAGQIAAGRVPNGRQANSRAAAKIAARERGMYLK